MNENMAPKKKKPPTELQTAHPPDLTSVSYPKAANNTAYASSSHSPSQGVASSPW